MAQTTKTPSIILLSKEEIIKKIPQLKRKSEQVKNGCKYKPFITGRLNDLIRLTRKKKLEVVEEISIGGKYNEIKHLINISASLDFADVMSWAGKGNQLITFLKCSKELDDRTYWQKFREAYTCQDKVYFDYDFLKGLFGVKRKDREHMMLEEERTFLSNLPDEVLIYRGCTEKEVKTGNYGIAWTLSKSVAEQFCNIKKFYLRSGVVVERTIRKDQIIAYFEDPEQEIVYFPD